MALPDKTSLVSSASDPDAALQVSDSVVSSLESDLESDRVLERVLEGDSAAVREFYEAFAPRVVGYLRARGAEDPESLSSEVFVQVIRRLPSVHGGARGLRTFLFSVAHARLVDDLRARARRPDQVAYDEGRDDRLTPSAEAEAIDNEAHDRALALLAELNEDQRAVLALRVVAGLSLEETAASLGRSIGAVKQLQRRGLLALRKLLSAEGVAP